ncbi:MAG: hypothetical protein Q7S22_06375 [Candidatus Micrarchaeota archaeon]|nr:hypothetical protein [Candidatus Micrarchaeota archaeon]
MKEIRVRIIHSESAIKPIIDGARRGVDRFKAYGVTCEEAVVSRTTVDDIRGGEFLLSAVSSTGLILVRGENFTPSFRELRSHRRAKTHLIGLGLTDAVIIYSDTSLEVSHGISTSFGALISTYVHEMDDIALKSLALESVVKHELGHVFGVSGHCEDTSCIMENLRNFYEQFIKSRRDFCARCIPIITAKIKELRES